MRRVPELSRIAEKPSTASDIAHMIITSSSSRILVHEPNYVCVWTCLICVLCNKNDLITGASVCKVLFKKLRDILLWNWANQCATDLKSSLAACSMWLAYWAGKAQNKHFTQMPQQREEHHETAAADAATAFCASSCPLIYLNSMWPPRGTRVYHFMRSMDI